MRDRVAAWLVFGPVGHFLGGLLDWTELLVRYRWARWRGRA